MGSVADSDLILHVLQKFRNRFPVTVEVLSNMDSNNLSLSTVRDKLIDQEAIRQKKPPGNHEHALVSKSSATVKCFNCNKIGHKSHKCRFPKNAEKKADNSSITCNLCNKVGHKSYECRSTKNENKSQSSKALSTKSSNAKVPNNTPENHESEEIALCIS